MGSLEKRKLACLVFFLAAISAGLFSSCGGSKHENSSQQAQEPPTVDKSEKPWRLGLSYNGVESTFDRIHVNSLHKAGYRGDKTVIEFMDQGPIDFSHNELKHTVIDGKTLPDRFGRGPSTHATGMALTACGAINSSGAVGIAPLAKIVTDGSASIVNYSLDTLTWSAMSIGYGISLSGSLEYLPGDPAHEKIHVVIAGNEGPKQPTRMAFKVPKGFYPKDGNIIVTVAVDNNNQLTSSSSNCGETKRFCIAVPSPGPTSPTAPIVSGAIALLMEAERDRPLQRYVQAILDSATPLANPPEQTGVGLLNVEAALNDLRARP
jgi:hypothetical protein